MPHSLEDERRKKPFRVATGKMVVSKSLIVLINTPAYVAPDSLTVIRDKICYLSDNNSLLTDFWDRYRDLSDKKAELVPMQLANEGNQLDYLCTQSEFSLINSRLSTNCGVLS
ncbi:hypothetical protein ACTXT7_015303 [Hymenolepis weldensis]